MFFRQACPEGMNTVLSNFQCRAITSNVIQIAGHKRSKKRKEIVSRSGL